MADALVSIQIIPKTPTPEGIIPAVDEAIKIIIDSGVKFQVNPLDTTMEGDLHELLEIIEKMNHKMVEIGCSGALNQIKISYKPSGASMDKLTEKYR